MYDYKIMFDDMKELAEQRKNLIEYWKDQAYKEKQRADYLYEMLMDFTYLKKELDIEKGRKK